ncbi:MAG: outer membrane protein transport protein [Gallionella sp.]
MKFKQTVLNCSVAAVLAALSGTAAASGFALIEQSGSGLGNAYAGGAAGAEDASTIFYNPAGMSRLNGKQVVVAGNMIKPTAKFSNTGSTAAALQTTNNGNGGDAGSWALVPNAYFAMELSPQTRVGLGINAPFGLQTEYDADWIGRFQAMKSKLQTINLNPAVSYDVNETVSFGAGLNYQRITGDLTSAVNYAAAAFGAVGGGATGVAVANAVIAAGEGEGVSTISGNDSAWGYNLGLLFKLSPQTRVGLAYRSTVKYTLSGTVGFSANRPSAATMTPVVGGATATAVAAGIAAATADGGVTLPITMPDSFSVSGLHQLDDSWDVMADATWTGWSVLEQLKIDRSSGTNLLTVQEHWKNTWRVAAGTSYRYNEQWKARAGLAFDQAPVSDTYRTARIPDNDRTWITMGGQYKPSKESALDFGYAHLFVKDSTIADMQAAGGKGNLIGTYKNSVDIFSVQYAHSF